MKARQKLKTGGAKVVSGAMSVVLAVGLMPLPAFASDLTTSGVTLTPQESTKTAISKKDIQDKYVIGTAYAAAEPAPELLGFSNPDFRSYGEASNMYVIFGDEEINENVDPFLYNYNNDEHNQLDGPSVYPGSRAGSPMSAAPTYGSSENGNKIWDLLPQVVLGTGSDTIPSNEATFYDNSSYARAVEKANDMEANTYHPIGVTYNRVDLNAMVATMYRFAAAGDSVVEKAGTDSPLSLRYDSATDIAENYERYVIGTRGYVKMKIDSGQAKQKTIALVQDVSDGNYIIIPDGAAEGTATQNRFLEAVQGITTNYFSGSGDTQTVTADELKNNVDYILAGGQASGDISTIVSQLTSDGLMDKTFYCTSTGNGAGSVFGVTMNSVENAQNVGRIVPFVYPELLDQSDFIAYYFDEFYHVKSGKIYEKAASMFDTVVRNANGSDSSSYLKWSASDFDGYKKENVQSIIEQGMGYLNGLANDPDVYLSAVLTPYAGSDTGKDQVSLENATITVPKAALSGGKAEPEPVVTLGSRTLVKGTDYEVTYTNNTAVGTGTATVTGKGNYKGSKEADFAIAAQNFTAAAFDIVLDESSYSYTGSAITPDVTVKMRTASGTVLKEGTDYTVSYASNVNAGTGKITVSGAGKYTGTLTKDFTISKAEVSSDDVTAIIPNVAYAGNSAPTISNTGTVVAYKGTYLPSNAYTISTTDNTVSSFYTVGSGRNAQTVYNQDKTATITFNTSNFESSYNTAEAKFSIVPLDLSTEGVVASASIADGTYTYSGEAQKPSVTVTAGNGYSLTAGEDYTVGYANNTNVAYSANGDVYEGASVTLTGTGNYTGTYVVGSFKISPKQLATSDYTIEAIPSQKATGKAIEPAVTIKLTDGTVLEPSSDFKATYSSNVEVGTASVAIEFLGNYKGTDAASTTFTIVAADAEDTFTADKIDVTLDKESYSYTGAQIKPTVTLKSGDNSLKEGTDYIVSYGDNVNAGDGAGSITLTGVGAYSGSFTKKFDIAKATLSSATSGLKVKIADQTYTGKAITAPEATVKLGSVSIPSADYKVSVEGEQAAIAVGDNYTAKIAFNSNNLEGDTTATFKIVPVDLSAKATGTTVAIPDLKTGKSSIAVDDIKDSIVVKATVGGESKELAYNTDYTVTLDKTTVSAGDTVTATVTGAGSYDKTATGTFKIVTDISSGFAIISDQMFTGEKVVPDAEDILAFAGDSVLAYGTDYTVDFSDNETVGTATAKLTGKGKYGGEIDATFEITPADLSNAVVFMGGMEEPVIAEGQAYAKYSTAYTGKAIEPEVQVLVDGVKLKQDETFFVAYDNNTAASDLASYSIYGDGENVVGNVDGYFTIARRSMAASTITATTTAKYAFANSKATPAFTVKDTSLGTTLKANTDYTVKGATAGKLAGAKTNVQIVGKGNYSAAKFVPLTTVVPTITVNSGKDLTYTGKALKPTVVVKDSAGKTIATSNYTVAYKNNTNAGTGTVTITGKGAYAGTATQTFTIAKAANPLTLKKASVSFSYNKSKAQTIAAAKYISKAGQGTVAYKVKSVSGKKTKAANKAKFTVSNKGVISVAKLTPKDVYTVTMQVSAAGNANYNASGAKTIAVTVTVK